MAMARLTSAAIPQGADVVGVGPGFAGAMVDGIGEFGAERLVCDVVGENGRIVDAVGDERAEMVFASQGGRRD